MKGNVCMSARANMAQPTQLWNTISRSWETPVRVAIMFVLVGRMIMKGRQARAIQPVRVARGGEFP